VIHAPYGRITARYSIDAQSEMRKRISDRFHDDRWRVPRQAEYIRVHPSATR
jgi:hypothetical protein